jgi:hypothetical protein
MTRGGAFVVAAALASLGCADRGPIGPRIVPWQLEADGTPPLVVGSYDTREKVHCRFLPDEQGQLRCLPSSAAALDETTAFADPTCHTQIYATDPGQEATFAARPVAVPLRRTDCAPKRYVVATLKPLGVEAPRYAGTPCAPVDAATGAREGALVVDRTEPPDRWATGTEVDGPLLPGHLRVREILTADGALFEDHLLDETLGKRCDIDIDVASAHVCAPTVLQFSYAHEGTDCMGTLAWEAPACADPSFIEDAETEYAIGAKWTGPVSNVIHGCGTLQSNDLSTTDGPDVYYERGAPVDTYAPAVLDLEGVGTGRLALNGVKGGDGSVVILDDEIGAPSWWVSARYFDTVAVRDCDPIWTAEGLVRCIPSALMDPTAVGFFSDAACTIPAYYCQSSNGVRCDGAPVLSTTGTGSGLVHATSLHEAVVVTSTFKLSDDSTCHAMQTQAPYMTFSVGDVLPWDAFPLLAEVNGRSAAAP